MKKILFLVPYPHEGPSARLRVWQFIPYLEAQGIGYAVRPFLTSSFYGILYKKGNILKKILYFLFCSVRRFIDTISALRYDVIFIHREAFPIGPPFLEGILFLCRKRIVFDYDDAIYLSPQGSSPIASFLKCPWKTDFVMSHSKFVIAGNEYLKDYAQRFNRCIAVIPTSIDTEIYKKVRPKTNEGIVIGWIGSHTTQVFLKELEDVFAALISRYRNLSVHLIGADPGLITNERVVAKKWSLDTELAYMREFDIGIMPMPDTEWTRGKCAFKAILYMSLEMPVVASPVGINKDIIKNGVNGYLAGTKAEWEEALTRLIDNGLLRSSMGSAGRALVVKGFSLKANARTFTDIIKKA